MEVLLSLVSGLAIAVTVQLLLTNLGIALGLTVLDWSPSPVTPSTVASDDEDAAETADVSLPVTHLLGAGVALTLSGVLFVAALLATEFSELAEPRRGAIFGLILWSVYWLLLIWLSSTTLSSLANSILGTAIAGGRRLFTTLRQTWRSPTPDTTNVESTGLQALAAELSQVRELREQLPTLLAQQRETLIQEISDRTDLSPQQVESVVDDITPTPPVSSAPTLSRQSVGLFADLDFLPSWQQMLQQALDQIDLSDWDAETLWHQAQTLLASDDAEPGDADAADASESPDRETTADYPHAGRVAPMESEAAKNGSGNAASTVLQDAQEYVRDSPVWALQPAMIGQTFRQRLHDPDADPVAIKQQVSQLHRETYVDWLRERGDIAVDQLDAIADHLTQVQHSVVAAVSHLDIPTDSGESTAETDLYWPLVEEKLLTYLRYTNLDLLTPDRLMTKIETVQAEAGLDAPTLRVPATHLMSLTDVLSRRNGLDAAQESALVEVLETTLVPHAAGATAGDRLAQLTQLLEERLTAVDWSVISLEDLKPELQNQLRSLDLRGEIDWQALRSRLRLPDDTKTALIDWLQETSQDLSRIPRRWAERVGESAQTWAEQLAQEVTQYLQFQDKSALQPQQIAAEITQVLKRGLKLLPNPADWPDFSDLKTVLNPTDIKAALENRRDLTIEEIQQISDWVEAGWQQSTQRVETGVTMLVQLTRDRLNEQGENLAAVRQQVVDQIADTQAAIQLRAAELKADVQRQADAARRQVAIAAWWLFFSLLSSGSAAAIAGWLAVKY